MEQVEFATLQWSTGTTTSDYTQLRPANARRIRADESETDHHNNRLHNSGAVQTAKSRRRPSVRAQWGRAPERGELRRLKLENRRPSSPSPAQTYSACGTRRRSGTAPRASRTTSTDAAVTSSSCARDRVEERLTERAAIFQPGELRAVLLEQSTGELAPADALAKAHGMIAERRVLPLTGGQMTTLAIRAKEQAIQRTVGQLASPADRDVGEAARSAAADQLAERIGVRLSSEQAHALRVITGPERTAVLIGPAGTGKGVVLDAAARAEQATGHQTFGIACQARPHNASAKTAPPHGKHANLDALVARAEQGRLALDAKTTIFFDEAGMADTHRSVACAKSWSARGRSSLRSAMVRSSPRSAPAACSTASPTSRRAPPSGGQAHARPAEQKAWADLRAAGRRAMAHYHRQGRLHMSEDRDQAVEQAVGDWAKLTETLRSSKSR